MARRRTRRRTAARPLPGWLWMSFGLALGLVVAGLVYLGTDRAPPPAQATTRPAPGPSAAPAASPPPDPAPAAAAAPDEDRTEFDFYKMLPSYEVVVPEYESEPRVDRRAATPVEPGRYVLQAGSFRTYADADGRAASLALIGIEARVQRVTIDDDVFHRVRIGPIDDLEQLNRIRRQLREARIEALLMRVP